MIGTKKKLLGKIIFAFVGALVFWSCSNQGLDTSSNSSSSADPNRGQSDGSGGDTANSNRLSELNAFIDGSSYDKLQSISVNVATKELIFRVPLSMNVFITSTRGQFANYPDISFITEYDSSGTAYLTLHIPMKYILRGVTSGNPSRLPNGDPLPMIPSGELPELALDINSQNKVKLHLYIAADFMGIYVESPFNPYIGLTFPIKNSSKTKILGYFSTIPAKNSYQGGFFLSFLLPPELINVLSQHVFGQ